MPDETYKLNAIDIAAMRQADRIIFRHKDGRSTVKAVKEFKATSRQPFAHEVEHEIACGMHWADFAEDRKSYPVPSFTGFDMIHASQYCEEWKTVAELVKVGDSLSLFWVRDGLRTENLTVLGLHSDTLKICVHRKDKVLTFHIGEYVGPHNTARMIRDVV